jgi:hypothetical protein
VVGRVAGGGEAGRWDDVCDDALLNPYDFVLLWQPNPVAQAMLIENSLNHESRDPITSFNATC